jgi:hypothetical protein
MLRKGAGLALGAGAGAEGGKPARGAFIGTEIGGSVGEGIDGFVNIAYTVKTDPAAVKTITGSITILGEHVHAEVISRHPDGQFGKCVHYLVDIE